MLPRMWWRALLIWVVIAGAEVVHGILRVKLLNPRVGDRRARQMAVGTGVLLNFFITWVTLPWVLAGSVAGTGELLTMGGLWTGLMLVFDVGFGRWVFRFTWERIGRDFDLRRGGLLGLGMLLLGLSPWLAAWLRS
jgi:hypothetical protein